MTGFSTSNLGKLKYPPIHHDHQYLRKYPEHNYINSHFPPYIPQKYLPESNVKHEHKKAVGNEPHFSPPQSVKTQGYYEASKEEGNSEVNYITHQTELNEDVINEEILPKEILQKQNQIQVLYPIYKKESTPFDGISARSADPIPVPYMVGATGSQVVLPSNVENPVHKKRRHYNVGYL